MSKFMLRRLGVADDPGHRPPHLQACLESVLEQSPLLMEDVLAGLKAALLPAPGKKAATMRAQAMAEYAKNLGVIPKTTNKAAMRSAVRASTAGYLKDILPLQKRHLPKSKM